MVAYIALYLVTSLPACTYLPLPALFRVFSISYYMQAAARRRQWQPIASMTTARRGYGLGALPHGIYAVGGRSQQGWLASVEKYDLENGQWTVVSNMKTKRARMGVVALHDSKLIAVGGYDSPPSLATVEEFDIPTNQWVSLPNMFEKRSGAGVSILDQMVYVVGGYDGSKPLNTMEMYDVRACRWERSLQSMPTARSGLKLAHIGGLLYAIGGNGGGRYLNIVECFDPCASKWRTVAPLTTERSSPGVAVLEDMLYVTGGQNIRGSC